MSAAGGDIRGGAPDPEIGAAAARARALIDLASERYPHELRGNSIDDIWTMVAYGLIARMTNCLDAIVSLHEEHKAAESVILGRSLFDHVVTFAWLAAEPLGRTPRFVKNDAYWRLKMDEDCRRLNIPSPLTDERRADFEAQLQLGKNMPDLAERAVQADRHWIGRIPILEPAPDVKSFRGFYAWAYRHNSSFEHASYMGLNSVAVELSDDLARVDVSQSVVMRDVGLISVLYTIALQVAAEVLGKPDGKAVEAVWKP